MARHAFPLLFGLICTALGGCDPVEDGEASDGTIRATLLWVDGSEMPLELAVRHARLEFPDETRHTCFGEDSEGFALSVGWPEGTAAGTSSLSIDDGPSMTASWPSTNSPGIRGTPLKDGTVTFDAVGTSPGDEVAGTASVFMNPDPSDPDNGVVEILDIEFSCVVSD